MCLEVVTEVKKPVDRTTVIDAYKIVGHNSDNRTLHFQCCVFGGDDVVPLDKWLKAEKDGSISDDNGKPYSPGFHCFATKKGAEAWNGKFSSWPIIKVKIRKIRTVGKQSGCKCYVADEMFVPTPDFLKG